VEILCSRNQEFKSLPIKALVKFPLFSAIAAIILACKKSIAIQFSLALNNQQPA
jgi:hypothetical protein